MRTSPRAILSPQSSVPEGTRYKGKPRAEARGSDKDSGRARLRWEALERRPPRFPQPPTRDCDFTCTAVTLAKTNSPVPPVAPQLTIAEDATRVAVIESVSVPPGAMVATALPPPARVQV